MSTPSARPRARVAHVTMSSMALRLLLSRQMAALRDAGFDVTGISGADGVNERALEEAGIRHIAVPMSRGATPLGDLWALLQLWRVLRREGFDIVHTHTPKGALRVPARDGSVLARAILRLLESPDTRRRMGEAARRKALREFDEQVVFAKIRATYERLLGR